MVALTDIQYRNIIQTLLRGFGDSRPNPRVAAILTAEANLGMRVGDILRLHMSDIGILAKSIRKELAKFEYNGEEWKAKEA